MLRTLGMGAMGFAAALAAIVFGLGCCTFSAPRYEGPTSGHFDGERFHNQGAVVEHGFAEFWKWSRNREQGPWREWTDAEPGPPPPRRVAGGAIRVTFVNHATTLIQIDGLNVLTDPIWSERATPVAFAGPRRVRPPGIRFEDLPPIDAVLVSHNHYDHADLPTLKRLWAAFRPRQSVELANGVRLTAVPVQHISGRGFCDRMATLWAGYVLEGKGGKVFFAGDTGYGPHFAQIREKFGPLTVSILPIGAFRPEWFMAPVHVSPEEAVKAHRVLGSRHSVAMHFGTFMLADDGQDEPVERLRAALARERIPDGEFRVLGFGEALDVAR